MERTYDSLHTYINLAKKTISKFGWTRSANTGLFLVFNSFKDNDIFDEINYRSIILKYSYQFDLL